MRTLDNINKFLVEKLGQKAQPTLLDAFNALSRAYGGEGKARSKEKALEELAIVFVGPGAPGVTLAKLEDEFYMEPALIQLIGKADIPALILPENVSGMFYSCSGLTSLNLSNFDTSKVTSMGNMFSDCRALTSLDVSNFDTSKVTSMSGMFSICLALTSLDVSNFDTKAVTSMSGMFSSCSALTSLDVSNFDTRKVTDMFSMFSNCSGLTSVKFPGEGKWASNASITTFDISAAPLDVASIQGLVTALATKTSQCSLKLKSANWEAAKAADSTLETTLEAKNWVVTAV